MISNLPQTIVSRIHAINFSKKLYKNFISLCFIYSKEVQ